MNLIGGSVYCLSLIALWLKCVLALSLQGRERLRARAFRYPEDASYWRGTVGTDTELCLRAQSLLRNDSETQPYFVALAGVYLLLGAAPSAAPFYFATYTLSRLAHGYFLLSGRQPHRTRSFGAGALVMTVLALHVCVAATHNLCLDRGPFVASVH